MGRPDLLIYYLGDDPHTRSIVIYMETVGNAHDFLSAAREVASSKPIIVIKAGRTDIAAKAAASHTGSLAGRDDVLEAAFRRCGVLRVKRIAELFYMADILGKQPRPSRIDRGFEKNKAWGRDPKRIRLEEDSLGIWDTCGQHRASVYGRGSGPAEPLSWTPYCPEAPFGNNNAQDGCRRSETRPAKRKGCPAGLPRYRKRSEGKGWRGTFRRASVQTMVKTDGYELILGSMKDDQFGPVVLFGAGGSLVERLFPIHGSAEAGKTHHPPEAIQDVFHRLRS